MPRKRRRTPAENRKLLELHALYRELPSVDCQGRCFRSCAFIGMTTLERQRVIDADGPRIELHMDPCPALNFMGRCSVYDQRPMVCRLYGVTEGLMCPYGCKPERQLSYEEGKRFLARAERISGDAT